MISKTPYPHETCCLVFDPFTGEIKSDHLKVPGDGDLHMYEEWTPYYTLDNVYFGFRGGNSYWDMIAEDEVESYWDLNPRTTEGDANDM